MTRLADTVRRLDLNCLAEIHSSLSPSLSHTHTHTFSFLPPSTVPPTYMLIAAEYFVRRISLDPKLNNFNDVALISGLNNTLALDYRLTGVGKGQIIFADKVYDAIYTSNLDGTGTIPVCCIFDRVM